MRRTRREGDLKLIGEWRWHRRRERGEGGREGERRGINCESPSTDRKGEGGGRAARCYIAPRGVF